MVLHLDALAEEIATLDPEEQGTLWAKVAKSNYSHLKWEFVWEPLEAVRVTYDLSNRLPKPGFSISGFSIYARATFS
jgi:hypothetical protein